MSRRTSLSSPLQRKVPTRKVGHALQKPSVTVQVKQSNPWLVLSRGFLLNPKLKGFGFRNIYKKWQNTLIICFLDCYWVCSLDLNFLGKKYVFSTKPPKVQDFCAGGSLQQPSFPSSFHPKPLLSALGQVGDTYFSAKLMARLAGTPGPPRTHPGPVGRKFQRQE